MCDINKQGIAKKIRSCNTKQQALKLLNERIQDGSLRYINNEVGINITPFFERKEKPIFLESEIGKLTASRKLEKSDINDDIECR